MDKLQLEKRISQVIKTDATIANRWDFLATHVPFKKLGFVDSGLNERKVEYIHEEDFFNNKVLAIRDDHNFIIIQGDNGSGKSHLIRWIKERYLNEIDQNEEAVIFIARSQSTLKGALEQIIKSNVFTEDFKENELKKLQQASVHLSESFLKKNIIHQFAIACEENINNDILESRYAKKLPQLLLDPEIQEILLEKDGPVERIKLRLSSDETNKRRDEIEPKFVPDDFKFNYDILRKMRNGAAKNAIRLAEDLVNISRGSELRERVAKFLNSNLEIVVQNSTNLRAADLKHIFEQLRIELKKQGKRLTLLIEDITSFTGIDKALVEVLVTEDEGTEYNETFCRIFSIVGVTTAYYKDFFPSNLKDRLTGRVLINDAVLLEKEDIINMAGRYMNAINLDNDILKHWMENGAKDIDLPLSKANTDYSWSMTTLDGDREASIFPFNEDSLWNMYSSLEHKTPRKFLKDVIKHVLRLYMNYDRFPPSPDILRGLYKIPEWKEPLHEQIVRRDSKEDSDNIISLLRLWGNGTAYRVKDGDEIRVGGLTEEVFKSFNLTFIKGVNIGKVEKTEGDDENGGGGYKPPIKKPQPDPSKPQASKEDKKTIEFKKMQHNLDKWLNNGPLKDYIKLRDDLVSIITTFIDWQSEGIPGNLVNAFLRGNRISIEGQVSSYNDGFQVKRSEESKYALLALSAWRILGEQSWDFENSIGYLTSLTNWLLKVKEDIIKAVRAPEEIDSPNEWDMIKWGLLNEFYIQLLAGNLNEDNSIEDIYLKIFSNSLKIEEQIDRSPSWIKTQKMLSRKSDLENHHDFVLKYYNYVLGDVTAHTNVYFIDTVEILNILNQLKSIDWDMKKIQVPNIDGGKSHIWYQSYNLLLYLSDKVNAAITDEIDETTKILNELENFISKDYKISDLQRLFEDINRFLTETLIDNNEPYNSSDFDTFIKGELTWEGLDNMKKQLSNILSYDDKSKQIMAYSSHPIRKIKPYIEFLNKTDALVSNVQVNYESKLNNIQDKANDVDEKLKEIKSVLSDMESSIDHIN